ncbi:hypothetical protein BGW41_006196 [Actinomortierella wolfii]|nr:hypothetical protein BGW41_006196 [Actinomortierella wolfii]
MTENKSQRLIQACIDGNAELVSRIASKFDNVQKMSEPDPVHGRSPLMTAARYGHDAVVERLLQLGHDQDEISRDPHDNNILMIAAQHGHIAVFERYARAFPRVVHLTNNQGRTALIAAARYGHVEMVKILLDLDADINHQDNDGATALHCAAAYGNLQCIEVLIQRGIDTTIKNQDGWTALAFAFSDSVAEHMEECRRSFLAKGEATTTDTDKAVSTPPTPPDSSSSTESQIQKRVQPRRNNTSPGLSLPKVRPRSLISSPSSPTTATWASLKLDGAFRKDTWASPLPPLLATLSTATSPRLGPSAAAAAANSAWNEFKRVVVKH